jgi:hypothetical protein
VANPKRERAITAAENSAAAKWQRARFRDNREPSTKGTPLFDRATRRCWCGVPWPHDWPGKDDGAPHPRNTPEDPQ